jgi:hypothetical protein
MVAEGIEQLEDVIALRDLGLRYGQGYYMARPAAPFIGLKDEIRAQMRSVAPNVPPQSVIAQDDDDEDEDRALAIPLASGSMGALPLPKATIPRNAFGRAEDEITSDFPLAAAPEQRPRPRASEPPQTDAPLPPWEPLTDEETTNSEPLLDALRKTAQAENVPGDERGGGGPGLN